MACATLLIADDHPLFRLGLKHALTQEGFDVIAEAQTGLEALHMSKTYGPDVAILDVKMPELDGITACGRLRDAHPNMLCIVLTTFEEQAIVQAARQAGAHGFFSKETHPGDLARAIRRIHEQPSRDWLPHVDLPSLTPREQQVLQCLSEGCTNKEMAKILGLSCETIKSYLANLYNKLGVNDRLSAINRAHQLGLLVQAAIQS